ncbi:VOC family protein [Paraglaciecola hydrolytica]|uniref:Glyoxalase n=1 Tax=Paraglaciecola hydrolytica TaxID=1799789 RepID=A0A136A0T5_9ALTE|nr:VOC family protein [Paraglaciecola hydrolytica]KXI28817.1 glyoxalase [Paraglaciecola hydrolytica]
MCNSSQGQTVSKTQSATHGVHHLGLSVIDVKQAAQFFCEILHFKQVGEKPDYPAIFVSDGSVMLTLWQTQDQPVAFDRHQNIGLHHFALTVKGTSQLVELYQRLLQHQDVEIEFAPESLGNTPAQHLMCRIPGGLRMELIALPGE